MSGSTIEIRGGELVEGVACAIITLNFEVQ